MLKSKDSMAGKSGKILITGNLGYVGPVVVKHFREVAPGTALAGLDSGFFTDLLLAPQALPALPVDQQIIADVRDAGPEIFEGVESVVHLAGISNDPIGSAFAAVTHEINSEATLQLAKLAREAGARSFVFASSCSVYGFAEGGPRNEQSEVGPLTDYAKSKVAAEDKLKDVASDDFTITCLRFATACGISPRLRLDLVLNDFVATGLSTGEIRILSDGTPWRPLINVSDMARAIEWAVARPGSNGGNFLSINAGSNEWNYQVRELAQAVADAIPGTTIRINPDAQPDKRSYRVNFDLFRSLAPNHQPLATLQSTILDLKAGLEKGGAGTPSFDPSSFIRLKRLTSLREQGRVEPGLRWQEQAASVS